MVNRGREARRSGWMTSVVVALVLLLVAAQWRLCARAGDSAALDAARASCLALSGQDQQARVAARTALRRSATVEVAFLTQRVEATLEAPVSSRAAMLQPDPTTNEVQQQSLTRLADMLERFTDQCEPLP